MIEDQNQMANHNHVDVVANGYGRALLGGFKLTWKPDLACQSCEATGGFCGHSTSSINKKFICLCTVGRHPSNCRDSGAFFKSTNEPIDHIATGLIILGG